MVNLNIGELRSQIDQEGKYVDFSILRTSLTVEKVVKDLDIKLTEPSKEGECRATCPKCKKREVLPWTSIPIGLIVLLKDVS